MLFKVQNKSLFLIIIALMLVGGGVQANKIDSLRNILDQTRNDTVRVNALNDLAEYYIDNSPLKTKELATQALSLARSINYVKGIAQAFRHLSLIKHDTGNYQQALKYIRRSEAIEDSISNAKGLAKTYNIIGVIYWNHGHYTKALDNFQRTIQLGRKLDNHEFIFHTLINVGLIYYSQQRYKRARKVFKRVLKAEREKNHGREISTILNNLAAIYYKKDSLHKARKYQEEAKRICEAMNDRKGYAKSLVNLANIYLEEQSFSEALSLSKEALTVNRELQDRAGVIKAYNNIGKVYNGIGRYDLAESYFMKSLRIAQNIDNYKLQKEIYKNLAENYFDKGSFKKAYEYKGKYIACKDSIINKQKAKELVRLEQKYQIEKKEKKIDLLEKEQRIKNLKLEKQKEQMKRQRVIRNTSIVVLVLLAILSYLFYNRYRVKQRANKQLQKKNKFINKQRQRILDSINYAKRIQRAMLIDEPTLNKNFTEEFIFYEPRDIVSGDFYWFSKRKGKKIMVTVDCTGHGVPGGFMSMIGYMLLNKIVNEKHIVDAEKIVQELHKGVLQSLQQDVNLEKAQDGMDVAVCVIDEKRGDLEFVGAPNSIYIIQRGEAIELKGGDQGIGGIFARSAPETLSVKKEILTLSSIDSIYMFSDGILDQFGGDNGEKFGHERLKELLQDICKQPMSKQKKIVAQTMSRWRGSHRQIDDMLLLGVRV